MDFEQELNRVAEGYRSQGYEATVRPGPGELPSFAAGFRVEIVARRGAEGVLVAVKRNRDELAADADMQRYARVTGAQPGWRFDFAILEAEPAGARDLRGARELSGQEIAESLEHAEQLSRTGLSRFAVVAAWAALEAAMRARLRALGQKAGWRSMPRDMLKELYSAGLLSPDEFRRLDLAFQFRNQTVHGFSPHAVDPPVTDEDIVAMLSQTTRRLLQDAQLQKQTA